MKKNKIYSLFWILLLTLPSWAKGSDLRLAYGSVVKPLCKQAISVLESEHKLKIVSVREDGMTGDNVVYAVSTGAADLGIAGNSIETVKGVFAEKKIEIKNIDQIKGKSLGFNEVKIVTWPKGPKTLDKGQLKKILTGAVLNWKEVGGEDLPIRLSLAANTAATQKYISNTLLDGELVRSRNSKTLPTHEENIAYVKQMTGAISFSIKGFDLTGLNIPEHPALRTEITAFTLGEPSESAKKVIEVLSKLLSK